MQVMADQRGGRTIPAHLAREFKTRLAGPRHLRAAAVGEDHAIGALAQIRNLILVCAGLGARIGGRHRGHLHARPGRVVLRGRSVARVHVRVHLAPAGRLRRINRVRLNLNLGVGCGELECFAAFGAGALDGQGDGIADLHIAADGERVAVNERAVLAIAQ